MTAMTELNSFDFLEKGKWYHLDLGGEVIPAVFVQGIYYLEPFVEKESLDPERVWVKIHHRDSDPKKKAHNRYVPYGLICGIEECQEDELPEPAPVYRFPSKLKSTEAPEGPGYA